MQYCDPSALGLLATLASLTSAVTISGITSEHGFTVSNGNDAATLVNGGTLAMSPLPTLGLATTIDSDGNTQINPNISSSGSCPANQLNYVDESGTYCCPGAVYGQGDSKYCCVGADFQVATPSFSDCFPFCSGSDNGVTVAATTQQSCQTTIPLTASDYSSLAAAAGSSTGDSAVTTTSDSTSSSASLDAGGNGSSGNVAAAMVTSGPYAGALMAAGGLLLAL